MPDPYPAAWRVTPAAATWRGPRAPPSGDDAQVLGQRGDDLRAVIRDDDEVLDAYADRARDVDARLDGHHVARGKRVLALLRQPRALVDLETHAVAESVPEVLAVAGRVDDPARHGVDLAAGRAGPHGREGRLLGAVDELVDGAVARVDRARREGPRAVARVAVELRAPVDDA